MTAEDYDRLLALDETIGKANTASEADLTMLPSFKAPPVSSSSSKSSSGDTSDHSCCICMCDIETGDMVKRLPCMHVFHAGM